MRRLDWADCRAAEVDALDAARTIAVLPAAAVEQHGPHLPVATDRLIAEGVLVEVRQRLPDHLDVRLLPVQAVGMSNEHLFAGGTLTLPAETALAAWTETWPSVARAGIRRLVVVNSHGGNLDQISIVSRELTVRAGGADELRYGIHGRRRGDVTNAALPPRDGRHGRRPGFPRDGGGRGGPARGADQPRLDRHAGTRPAWRATPRRRRPGRAGPSRPTGGEGFIALLRQVRDMRLDGFAPVSDQP